MTDKELKELVSGLATSNAENAKMFEETKQLFKETDKQFKETDNQFKEIAERFKETDKQFKETDRQFKETDKKMLENATELRKTEEILKNLGIHIGGMANSHGQSTEEYFYNSLAENPRLGNIKFDEISRNLHFKIPNLEDEFDITMFNGNNIGLIECKYRAKEEDVIKLIDKKIGNFRTLYPLYANHTIYLGIASFSFDARLEKFARDNGVAILRQRGDVVEIEADNLKAY
jgi:hypothetical protein